MQLPSRGSFLLKLGVFCIDATKMRLVLLSNFTAMKRQICPHNIAARHFLTELKVSRPIVKEMNAKNKGSIALKFHNMLPTFPLIYQHPLCRRDGCRKSIGYWLMGKLDRANLKCVLIVLSGMNCSNLCIVFVYLQLSLNV